MSQPVQFPFFPVPGPGGASFPMPYVPVLLRLGTRVESVTALIDSGAAVSVLPYDVGIRLGADWNALTVRLSLTGNLAAQPAKALAVELVVSSLPAVPMVFAWSLDPNVPVILGQLWFFDAFDIRFCRSRNTIEIEPRP